jgi:hypothetical protein
VSASVLVSVELFPVLFGLLGDDFSLEFDAPPFVSNQLFARISVSRVACRGLHKQSALNDDATLYSVQGIRGED